MKNNKTVTSLNTGGNLGSNDAAEKIANMRRRDATSDENMNNNDENMDNNSADFPDTDSDRSRSKSPNARSRLAMNGRR